MTNDERRTKVRRKSKVESQKSKVERRTMNDERIQIQTLNVKLQTSHERSRKAKRLFRPKEEKMTNDGQTKVENRKSKELHAME